MRLRTISGSSHLRDAQQDDRRQRTQAYLHHDGENKLVWTMKLRLRNDSSPRKCGDQVELSRLKSMMKIVEQYIAIVSRSECRFFLRSW